MKLPAQSLTLLLILPLFGACDDVSCVSDQNGLVCEAEGSYDGRLARTTGVAPTCSDGSEQSIEIDPRDVTANLVVLDQEEKLFEITIAGCTFVGNPESDSSIVLFSTGPSSTGKSCGDSLKFTKIDNNTAEITVTGLEIKINGTTCLVEESGSFTKTVSVVEQQQQHS